jgi:hypothetical protein
MYGGIPVTNSSDWVGNIARVNPGWLKESGNVLHIGSRTSQGFLIPEDELDDFLIDNVVIQYKTR